MASDRQPAGFRWYLAAVAVCRDPDCELSPGARLVLRTLADRADTDGVAWPKQASLGDEVGMPVRTLKRYLNELEDGGYIVRQRRQYSNAYILQIGHPRPISGDGRWATGGPSDRPPTAPQIGHPRPVHENPPRTTQEPPSGGDGYADLLTEAAEAVKAHKLAQGERLKNPARWVQWAVDNELPEVVAEAKRRARHRDELRQARGA